VKHNSSFTLNGGAQAELDSGHTTSAFDQETFNEEDDDDESELPVSSQ